MRAVRPARAPRGFSLIEVLVVLTIIGLLMTFTAVGVSRYREAGRISECRARIEAAALQAESYADRMGDYPPARLAELGVKDSDRVNEGIEAFVAALRDPAYGGLRPNERWLGNGDDDRSEAVRGFDGSTALLELLDPWDNPIAYIPHAAYDEAFVLRVGDGAVQDDVDVRALVNPLTGAWHHFEGFQLRSAGPDGLFDSEDDIANFEIPADDS